MGIFSTSNGIKSMLENAKTASVAKVEEELVATNETFEVGDDFAWMAAKSQAAVAEASNELFREIGMMEYAIAESTGFEAEYEALTEEETIESVKAGVAEFEEGCKKEACAKEGCCKEGCKCGKCEACKAKAAKAVNEADEEEKKEEEPKADEEKKDDAPKADASNPSKFANSKFVVCVKKIIGQIKKFFADLKQKVVNALAKFKDAQALAKIAKAVSGTDDAKVKEVIGDAQSWSETILNVEKWDSIVDFKPIEECLKSVSLKSIKKDNKEAKSDDKKADEKPEEKKDETAKEESFDWFNEEESADSKTPASTIEDAVRKAFTVPENIDLTTEALYKAYKGVGNNTWSKESLIRVLNKASGAQAKANKALSNMESKIVKAIEAFNKYYFNTRLNDKAIGSITEAQSFLTTLNAKYTAASSALAKAFCACIGEARTIGAKIAGASGDADKKEDSKEEAPKADEKKEEVKEEEFDFLGAFDSMF